MVGRRRSSPVFVEKGLSRLARQLKAAKAQAIAERVVLPRPEGTSENSQGQRPWKTTAPRWSSPDGARERRVKLAGFARSYRACPRTILRSRGVAPGYFRLPFQGSVARKTGYPVGGTDKCAERHLFWNLDMHLAHFFNPDKERVLFSCFGRRGDPANTIPLASWPSRCLSGSLFARRKAPPRCQPRRGPNPPEADHVNSFAALAAPSHTQLTSHRTANDERPEPELPSR